MTQGSAAPQQTPPIDRCLIYHFLPIETLQAVLASGELLSHNRVQSVSTVSNPGIQANRAMMLAPDPPGGTLHDYVPFYFGPRSPMLFQNATGRVPSFQGDQRDLVYCVSSVARIQASGRPFFFTDGHAVVAITQRFTDVADLDKVDWPVTQARIWNDTREDNDRQRRKQAEFLVQDSLPVSALFGFAVADEDRARDVRELLKGYPNHTFEIPARVRLDWYYENNLRRRR